MRVSTVAAAVLAFSTFGMPTSARATEQLPDEDDPVAIALALGDVFGASPSGSQTLPSQERRSQPASRSRAALAAAETSSDDRHPELVQAIGGSYFPVRPPNSQLAQSASQWLAQQGEPAPGGEEPQVLVAEVFVQGVDGELEDLIYDTVNVRPGLATTRSRLQADVNAIFATGFFANVQVDPQDTPLGVRITFVVEPNPVLENVEVQTLPATAETRVLPERVVDGIFGEQYGDVLNLLTLQENIDRLNAWYDENGYSLAQVVGTPEVGEDGTVTLSVAEGLIEDIRVRYFDVEGEEAEGKTRAFIVTREMQLASGDVFNQDEARRDLQRVFGLGLFEDAQLSFEPAEDPTKVVVFVDLVEGRSGSLGAGAGISSASGLFGSISYQEQNLGGNNQNLGVEFQLGTRDELLFDVSFRDPWIAGNEHRSSYSLNGFRRQSISLIFDGGENEVELPNGDRPRVVRTGGGVSFTRPLIDDPFDEAEWTLSTGLEYQNVAIRDADGDLSPRDEEGQLLSFDEDGTDNLFLLQLGATRDRRNNRLTPTSGSVLRFSVNQALPFSSDGLSFSRLRTSYSFYIPVSLINLSNGPQALAFNLQGGTVIGDFPPYEAFSLGGGNSVRGYESGDVGSGRSYAQGTIEYRFPIISVIGGALFVDAATDLGSGDTVQGNPAGIRDKPGSGLGYGVGVRIQSPLGPIRVDFAVNDEGDNRVHFGIGERF